MINPRVGEALVLLKEHVFGSPGRVREVRHDAQVVMSSQNGPQ